MMEGTRESWILDDTGYWIHTRFLDDRKGSPRFLDDGVSMKFSEDGTSERVRLFSPAFLLFLMLRYFEVGGGMRKIASSKDEEN